MWTAAGCWRAARAAPAPIPAPSATAPATPSPPRTTPTWCRKTLTRDTSPAAAFTTLQAQADHWFAEEDISAPDRRVTRTVDMRYAGQNYELPVALPEGPITQASLDALAEGFAAAHRRMYGFIAEEEPVQLV